MKTLSKIIGTFALAGLAFLPSCGNKAKQQEAAKLLDEKIAMYDKLTQSYEDITKATKKLEANRALTECRDDLASAIEFQMRYLEDEKVYMQTLRLINVYNDGLVGDAHNSDLPGLSQVNRYLGKATAYNQSLSTRLDTLKKAIHAPEPQKEPSKPESPSANFETVIKKSKEYKSVLESIEKFAKEDVSYMGAIIQYSKTKADKESEGVCKLAEAIKANRESLYSTALARGENLERSTKKLQKAFAGCVSEFMPDKKEEKPKVCSY